MAKFARTAIKRLLIASSIFGTLVLVVGVLQAILQESPVVILPIIIFIFHVISCIIGIQAVNRRTKGWANISLIFVAICVILCIVLIVGGFALAGLNRVCNRDTNYCEDKNKSERFEFEIHFALLFLLGFLGIVGTVLNLWLCFTLWKNRYYLKNPDYIGPSAAPSGMSTPRALPPDQSSSMKYEVEAVNVPHDFSYDSKPPSSYQDEPRSTGYEPSSQRSWDTHQPRGYEPSPQGWGSRQLSRDNYEPSPSASYGSRKPSEVAYDPRYDPQVAPRPVPSSRGSSGSRGDFTEISRSGSVDI